MTFSLKISKHQINRQFLKWSIIQTGRKAKLCIYERRHALYTQCNNQARSCNYCCSRKSVSITYSECVPVALVIQHVMSMCHIVMWLAGSILFFHIISQMAQFWKNVI